MGSDDVTLLGETGGYFLRTAHTLQDPTVGPFFHIRHRAALDAAEDLLVLRAEEGVVHRADVVQRHHRGEHRAEARS